VCDGVIIDPVDTTFELIWRTAGGADTVLATWTEHFDPIGGGVFDAQPCQLSAEAIAIDFAPGDQLVYRYTGEGTALNMAYIPAGDGELVNGRIPYIDLPQ
jgi:hypothetical protein